MGAQVFIPPSLARPAPLERPSRSRGAEACALLLFFGALFLTVAHLSYQVDPHNPNLHGANWMGAVGESIAAILVGAFGAAAWWVPAELMMIGAPLLKGKRPHVVALRVAGDLVILVLISSLIQVAFPELKVFGNALPGGDVGLLFGELLRGLFSAPGSFLVGLTGIGLILIGRSSFSFIEWCQKITQAYHAMSAACLRLVRHIVTVWKNASAVRLAEAQGQTQGDAEVSYGLDQSVRDSAHILANLEANLPWVPHESTGAPPLSVSKSLRQKLRLDELWDEESPGFTTSPLQQVSPSSIPPQPSEEGPDWETLAFGDLEDANAQADEETLAQAEGEADESLEAEDDTEAYLDDDTEAEEDDEADEAAEESSAISQAAVIQTAAAKTSPPELEGEPRIVDTSQAQATRAARRDRQRQVCGEFVLPDTDLLLEPEAGEYSVDKSVILRYSDLLEKTLADYGVTGRVEEIHPGPTVTTFEVAPAAGTKVSKVASLSDDLALGLSRKVRIIAPIPGKSRIGFEVPNDERVPVNLRQLVEDERFQALAKKAPLPVVLGRDIVGAPFYADLSAMPHVIVAGATGAGKSVGLNVMLSSLLFKRSPEELRLLMIDPKVVELAPFDKIPHLLLPVVTDMNQASVALKWAVDEMERRYQLFADAGTKNITTYNRYVERVKEGKIPPPRVATVDVIDVNGDLTSVPSAKNGQDGVLMPESIPYIVIVIDEFADLIMQQGKEVETSVARLAQKARAAGMHVILATQRPSVDVITGMIKANFPSRIAFRVAQKVDSRTILDEMGAEVLLGKGDMLVKLNGSTDTLRVQCPFVSEEEINTLCDHLRAQGEPKYDEAILQEADGEADAADDEPVDARFEEAVLIVRDGQRCSTSWLQRKMTIGYNRAAKMVDMMERRGYVGPPNGSKDREVMLPP